MKRRDARRLNKGISIWLIIMLLMSMLPVKPMSASAAASQPITIAQGNTNLGINDPFTPDYWNIGHDAVLQEDRIVLTPASGNKKGFAYMKNSIHLSEDLSFNAKYTFKISDSDRSGADGIAFVIQSESNTAGAEGEGMGYSGIAPSVVVEIDTYYNPGIDPSESHIAIMKNGNYRQHLASKNLPDIDQDDTKQYSVWVDYSAGQMEVFFAEDNSGNATKPGTPHVAQKINFKEIFGETRDVFVGFSSATGGSWSKHEILGVFFDSEYTSTGIKENDNYVQAPKPDEPAAMTITKQMDQEVTVTPETGKTYIFYENELDVKPIASGTELLIEPSMNTNGKNYYYSVVDNGVQSDRAPIKILMEDKGIFTSEGSTTFETGNPEIIDENITIDIYSSPTLDQASVVIDNFKDGDMLSFTKQGGISGSYNDEKGVLTLGGNATIEEYQTALRSVEFSTTSTSAAEREITFTISPNDLNMSDKKTMKKAKYFAQVIHGNGGGEYTSGTKVSITAGEAPEGQRFKAWEVISGDVALADVKASTTTFIMPAGPVEVKATYEVIPYEVKVENGTGDGEYTPGTTVTIIAGEALDGERFKSWEVTNGDVALADVKASTTTFIMPSVPVEVKAVYETIYAMTVENGTGTGAYAEGETVTITAGEAFEGQRFKAWEVTSGDVTLTNAKESVTTFTMPSGPVEVKATYEVIPYEIIVENGTGDGEYTPGTTVTIIAGKAPDGERFKSWEVTNGDVALADVKASTTTFIMSSGPVEVKAVYESIYRMTVENGTGTGAYTEGDTVTITAEEAPEGQRFKSWEVTSGDVTLTNAKKSTTNFTMPSGPVEVKATYEVIPYEVIVENGTGDGAYIPGTTVTITAGEAPEGQRFKTWEVLSGDVALANAKESTTTFTMPAGPIEVKAVYESIYTMTVENGTGAGKYAEGETVTITAGEAPEGQRFKSWEVTSGDVTLTNAKKSTTTFTMPSGPIEVKATYEVIPYEIIVENGTGDGAYIPGTTVTITAEEAPEGQRFKSWEVTKGAVDLEQATSAETTFKMPSEAVIVKAVYKALTEKEIRKQLEEAANSLTLETAFTFSKEDTWESITLPFFMLTEGKYDTAIEWTSSNPDVISINGHSATTHRQKKGKSVILTATVSKGDYSIKKTFLLIVKSNLVKNKASESIKRKAGIKYGEKNTTLDLIERINLYNSNNLLINKIDKIIVDEQMITSNTNNSFSVYLSDNPSDPADELAIEINSAALKKIQGDLEVKTDQATILLSKEEINRLNKNILDLYFRVVPVRNQQTKEDIKKGILADSSLKSLLNSINIDAIAKMLGTPKEIETNYSGYRTEVILPITEFYYESMNLDNIRVYIEHSDGTIDIQEGTITYDKGTPVGFKFAIDKFSTFTLLEIEIPEDASSHANKGNNGVDGHEPTADHDNSNGNQGSIDDNNEDVESQKDNEQGESLPKTASNMFSYLFIGLLLLIAGLSIYYYKRLRKERY